MYAVIMASNFDADVTVSVFSDYDTATKYMHWQWCEYYGTEENQNNDNLDQPQCFCEEEYGKVGWKDGCYTEFIVSAVTDADPNFYQAKINTYGCPILEDYCENKKNKNSR